MKRIFTSLTIVAAMLSAASMTAETFVINDTDYDYTVLTQKQIGPGVTYTRLRIPDFPLNVNYMVVDLTNPYNAIETQQASEKSGSTEKLATAYTRKQQEGKKPLGGQNGNFWVVSGQGIYSTFCLGSTYNGNLKNGQIITETNCYSDQWDGGPTRTGVVGIDKDKKLWIESMTWKGVVTADRWNGGSAEIILANKFARSSGEMTLYNSFYGRTKKFQTIEQVDGEWKTVDGKSCEVYLNLNEGQEWRVGENFTATVKETRKETTAGTLGDYDLCLSGTGSYKTMLEQLQVGDQVTINYGWTSIATGETPKLTNLIGGNAMVMVNGELTGRNEDETYNSQVYSRSAYGMSQDGKTLYMLVIDKSIDPNYGSSVGCNTSVMCQIMKQLGAWNVLNVDAGGSAQLMVQGDVVNKTTEGTPRAVANGWMVYSVAPDDETSSTIASIEFLDPKLEVPIYSTYTPTILGYNKYGELINENVEGVTLTCDATLGEADGNSLHAGGQATTGTLTATVGGVTVTKEINIVDASINMKINNIVIDDREYPLEVNATTAAASYPCDASRLEWAVGDSSVATVTDGVLKGITNGETAITGTINSFTTQANVSVEIPATPALSFASDFFNEIKLSQSGGTGLTATADGDGYKLTYTGNGSGRGANIQMAKTLRLFGLPTALRFVINPGDANITKISANIVNGAGEKFDAAEIYGQALTKNQSNEIVFQLSDIIDVDDISNYPLTINQLRFTMGSSAKNTEFSINMSALETIYKNYGGVSAPTMSGNGISVYPNPAVGGTITIKADIEGAATVSIFNNVGSLMQSTAATFDSGRCTLSIGDLNSGLYFVNVKSKQGGKTIKLFVK